MAPVAPREAVAFRVSSNAIGYDPEVIPLGSQLASLGR